MTEFVFQQNEIRKQYEYPFEANDKIIDFAKVVLKYAKFLSQPLTLGMFVPVGEEGSVLEEPKSCFNACSPSDWSDTGKCKECKKEVELYEKAKEKVLFEGFFIKRGNQEVDKYTTYLIHKETKNVVGFKKEWVYDWEFDGETIESLTTFNLILTPSAIKQIGL